MYDVLHTVVGLLAEDPQSMVPAFDRKKAHTCVIRLLASPNELIRLPALKMLGFFLSRATNKCALDSLWTWHIEE